MPLSHTADGVAESHVSPSLLVEAENASMALMRSMEQDPSLSDLKWLATYGDIRSGECFRMLFSRFPTETNLFFRAWSAMDSDERISCDMRVFSHTNAIRKRIGIKIASGQFLDRVETLIANG